MTMENWDTLEEYLWHYIEKASLKQPADTRVAGSLRSRKFTYLHEETLNKTRLTLYQTSNS